MGVGSPNHRGAGVRRPGGSAVGVVERSRHCKSCGTLWVRGGGCKSVKWGATPALAVRFKASVQARRMALTLTAYVLDAYARSASRRSGTRARTLPYTRLITIARRPPVCGPCRGESECIRTDEQAIVSHLAVVRCPSRRRPFFLAYSSSLHSVDSCRVSWAAGREGSLAPLPAENGFPSSGLLMTRTMSRIPSSVSGSSEHPAHLSVC